MNKDGRRSSIHDITSVGNGDISAPQGPITGQSTGAAAGGSSGNSAKQPPQHPAAPAGVGVYGAPTIGQPIGGPLISAVGTPVNLPGPAHMAYGVRAPVPGAVVPGAPVNMGPPTYPMPHASSHRKLSASNLPKSSGCCTTSHHFLGGDLASTISLVLETGIFKHPKDQQLNCAAAGSWNERSAKTPPQHPAAPACVGIYGGPTIWQLIYEPPCPCRCPGTYPMLHTSCHTHRCTKDNR
ncbi:hypothetical protein V6N11_072404 [Hibiscus sabdariffa]|uniref:Uncharacterized protein n=1 Tax=Hibiscus sabdariffa TaxID=183260 RepID=A0ABR2U369_9ROSI